jgi:SAM-dependent methyltransferase
MTTDERTIEAWTAYWRTGRGVSCFHGPDAELRLTQIWDAFVDELSDGVRILDLATGNGAVARLCAARARARGIGLQIEAVDAAEIDPAAVMKDPDGLLRAIRFSGGVRLEALPFAEASFAAVVSQFGFEYADQEKAAAEAVRALAPAGRLLLVAHARDGGVFNDIGARVERLRGVLAEHGAVSLVRTLAHAAEAGDANAVARESERLAGAIEQVRGFAAHAPRDDAAMFYASAVLEDWARRQRYHAADLRRAVEAGWVNAAGVLARQEQLLRVAYAAADVAALNERFAAAGLAVEAPEPVRDEQRGAQIAWLVSARRPPV